MGFSEGLLSEWKIHTDSRNKQNSHQSIFASPPIRENFLTVDGLYIILTHLLRFLSVKGLTERQHDNDKRIPLDI